MWRTLGSVAVIAALAFIAYAHPDDFGLAPVRAKPRGASDLVEALQSAKSIQDDNRNRLVVLHDLMAEIKSQNGNDAPGPGGGAAVAGAASKPAQLGGNDAAALERVRSWNIPAETKAEILRNYRQTGYLPVDPSGLGGGKLQAGDFVEATADVPAQPRAPASAAPQISVSEER